MKLTKKLPNGKYQVNKAAVIAKLRKKLKAKHEALALGDVPHVLEVVDAVAELVDEEGGGLVVRGLDPVGEEATLVRLVPQVLVQVIPSPSMT